MGAPAEPAIVETTISANAEEKPEGPAKPMVETTIPAKAEEKPEAFGKTQCEEVDFVIFISSELDLKMTVRGRLGDSVATLKRALAATDLTGEAKAEDWS